MQTHNGFINRPQVSPLAWIKETWQNIIICIETKEYMKHNFTRSLKIHHLRNIVLTWAIRIVCNFSTPVPDIIWKRHRHKSYWDKKKMITKRFRVHRRRKNTCPLFSITVEVSVGLQNAVYVVAGESTSGVY